MKFITFTLLTILLSSCSTILFYDVQSCEGTELKKIPKDFVGSWKLEGASDTIANVLNRKKFSNSNKLYSLGSKEVKCFQKDDFYILNIMREDLWDLTIIKKS